jgi:16S rRNA (guanine527-N7)-methyltransferase
MDELAHWAAAFGISLTGSQLEQFAAYEACLIDWNEKISLTAIREPRDIRRRHFLDSLACVTVTGSLDEQSLIDIGSGAGFPGLPLKILFPELELTLVDSVAKKMRFLEHVVNELRLRRVTFVVDRAEAIGQDAAFREQYDWAAARAVAELRVLVEYLLPLCRVGGQALAQKGESAMTEVAAASPAIAALGGGEAQVSTVRLPGMSQVHHLVVIPKLRPTDGRYPRRPGIPAKRPL